MSNSSVKFKFIRFTKARRESNLSHVYQYMYMISIKLKEANNTLNKRRCTPFSIL